MDTYIHGTQELLGVGDAKGKKLKFDIAALWNDKEIIHYI